MRARGKLQTQLTETEEALQDLTPTVTAAESTAETAAKATGVPAHEWDATLRQAHEQQQQWRLRGARDKDQRDLGEDTTYLRQLQRDLDGVESEHTRREQLTPEQRAREGKIRTQTKAKNQSRTYQPPSTGRAPEMPYRGPNLGPGTDQGHGL
jgi:hypothetical protein